MRSENLERAAYQLSLRSPLAAAHPTDPAGALAQLRATLQSDAVQSLRSVRPLSLTPDEVRILEQCDAAEMYKRGVHPNVIRNYCAMYGVDYVQRYRDAGLRT